MLSCSQKETLFLMAGFRFGLSENFLLDDDLLLLRIPSLGTWRKLELLLSPTSPLDPDSVEVTLDRRRCRPRPRRCLSDFFSTS